MPYVPSKKTDGKSDDRILIDEKVVELSKVVADSINTNRDVLLKYISVFCTIGIELLGFEEGLPFESRERVNLAEELAHTVYEVGKKYNYEGAFLGELNYAITRLIQEVPKRLVEQGKQKSELRYFIYAYTVEALTRANYYFNRLPQMYGIGGVFEDIKDEYKRRVNTSYEVAQIIKSGDCYDTPYLTQPAEVEDQNGKVIGHIEVMIKRENYDGKDVSGKVKIEK